MRMAYLRKPEDTKRGANPGKPQKFVAGKSKMPAVPVGEPAGIAGEDEASMFVTKNGVYIPVNVYYALCDVILKDYNKKGKKQSEH